ncbi:P-loop containing nucleoside triphosphate hydrolase protein [Cytidiella melzeri]|nr:P-loop containing nucleoside triphosphate hydrolase protein [Cytidiella melzeri]
MEDICHPSPTRTSHLHSMATHNSGADAVIFVMGPTGAGKTTFINVASKSDLRVGSSLQSCTDQIQFSRQFHVKDKDNEKLRRVVLVDSPGFDDTEKSDSDILKIICEYLASEYEQKHLLQGVIYLHRITDNRVSGTSLRNLQAYQELCGTAALANSVIATTMWSRIDPKLGANYEQELSSKEKFFKPAVDYGAKFLRHVDTEESAHDIIRELLGDEPKPLRIQQELVDEKKKVFETAAGEALMRELAKAEQKHYQEFLEVEKELADAKQQHDEAMQQELEEEYARLEEVKKNLAAEKAKLLDLQLSFAALLKPSPPETRGTRPSTVASPTLSGEGGEEGAVIPKKSKGSILSKLSRCVKSLWKRLLALLTWPCIGTTNVANRTRKQKKIESRYKFQGSQTRYRGSSRIHPSHS